MAAPYDTINAVLNAARVRMNDAIQSIGGDVLTNAQPFTLVAVNSAWRVLQRTLAGLGYWTLEEETIITGLAAIVTADPATQVYIDWDGYYNGTATDPAKVLPDTLIEPLDCWEREATTTDEFQDMDLILDGLPRIPQVQGMRRWEFRANKLYMPGSLTDIDLLVRYSKFLADFTDPSVTPTQPVPIVQCLDPFSNLICAEMSKARGDIDGQQFVTAAMAGCQLIALRNGQAERGALKASEYGKMADAYTPPKGGQ